VRRPRLLDVHSDANGPPPGYFFCGTDPSGMLAPSRKAVDMSTPHFPCRARTPLRTLVAAAVLTGGGVVAPGAAEALTFQVRFVERIGTTDVVIGGNGATVDASDGAARRIRVQLGVFDDGAGAAPAGGFVGWDVGTVSVSGTAGNSQERRTPGRIAPFNSSTNPNANGNPPPPTLAGPDSTGFDFQTLVEISAALGPQSPLWLCNGSEPMVQPPPTIRGRNAFVSVYEITIDPAAGAASYTVTLGGNLIAASSWTTLGTPFPPDCDNGIPGTVTYAPLPTAPLSFTAVLNVSTASAPTGACCAVDGGCTVSTQSSCSAGSTWATGGVCTPNPCTDLRGACCDNVSGACTLVIQSKCGASATWSGLGTTCTPNVCLADVGACCHPATATCASLRRIDCTTFEGAFMGTGATCLPNPCEAPVGACCNGSVCTLTTWAECLGFRTRRFLGNGSTCVPGTTAATTGWPTFNPCCKGDFNASGAPSVQDLFDFLAAYFAGCP
jgi:hypothetical protein